MSIINNLIDNAVVFDYETKDPYLSMNMGAGWVFSINHSDVAKAFPICVCTYKVGDSRFYYDNNIKNSPYDSLDEFDLKGHDYLVGHNLPYDLGWYLAQKFEGKPDEALHELRQMYLDGVTLIDTMILARLYDEHLMSISLSNLARIFKVTQKSEDTLADAFWESGAYADYKMERTGQTAHKKPLLKTLLNAAYCNLDKLDPEVVVSYCQNDVKATHEIMLELIKKLKKEYTEDEIYSLIKRYSDMLYISVDMRLRGVRVHIPTLMSACTSVSDKLETAKQDVMRSLQDGALKADKTYMVKFLLQFYWHPADNTLKQNMGNKIKNNIALGGHQQYWDKFESKVFEFLHVIQEGDFKNLKFSGSSSHPALMFLLSGYKKEDFKITDKGRVTTAKDWMEDQGRELGSLLNRVRKVDKMLSGFIQPAMNTQSELHSLNSTYGKVYPEFKIGGARSMRYTCSNPNLQQVPKRDPEFGPMCRSMFHAKEGGAFLAPDFSSQESRLQVHVAYKLGAAGADKLHKAWNDDPAMDIHMKTAIIAHLICPKECGTRDCPECEKGRSNSKEIALGLPYGMGDGTLCERLHLPTVMKTYKKGNRTITYKAAGPEGQDIIDKYNKLMPFVKEASDALEVDAKTNGYVRAVCGRHVHPPYFLEGFKKKIVFRKFFNYIIQGSAAGQLHIALSTIYKYICNNPNTQLQLVGMVHDEVLATCPIEHIEESKNVLEQAMITAIPLEVPVLVDTQIGQSWLGGDLEGHDYE